MQDLIETQDFASLNKTIAKIARYIIATLAPEQIIVFGSWAKGMQNVHSDIDLLIIADHIWDTQSAAHQIQSYVKELSLHSDILIRKKSEIEVAKSRPNSFLGSIYKEGKIIYKKVENSCRIRNNVLSLNHRNNLMV